MSHYSISDHFPVCFSRKINNKISESDHITTSYRSFKTFNEDAFINDLSGDLNRFTVGPQSDINDDLMIWYSIFLNTWITTHHIKPNVLNLKNYRTGTTTKLLLPVKNVTSVNRGSHGRNIKNIVTRHKI